MIASTFWRRRLPKHVAAFAKAWPSEFKSKLLQHLRHSQSTFSRRRLLISIVPENVGAAFSWDDHILPTVSIQIMNTNLKSNSRPLTCGGF